MLIFIFKSTACMAIFFVFYKLLLEKENMHVFKRFYLLLAIGASLLIPNLVFTEYVVVDPSPYLETPQAVTTDYDYIGVPSSLENDVLDIEPILWTIYFLGFTFFGLKFIKNLGQIIRRIRKNPKQKSDSFIQVLLRENFPPHTFFKYIFLNKKKLELNEIPKEVLLHEETHAKQKHSWDVVFIELLQVVFWFNPLVYLFKKAIKLNHEFLADQAVLDKDIDKTTYQNTLLSYSSPDSQNKYQSKMANAINYSSTRLTVFGKTFTFGSAVGQVKKRFTVMKRRTSKKAILFRSLLLLPLLVILLYGFAETRIIQKETTPEIVETFDQKGVTKEDLAKYNLLAKKYNKQPIEVRVVPLNDLEILENLYGKMSKEQKTNAQPFPECPPAQDGASRELMAEYDKLAKHYNKMPRNKMKIYKKDVERLEYIYSLMSEKQKADAEPFPDFPEPPPPPKAPKAPKEAKAPKVKKVEKSDIPPPPPPPSDLSDEEFAEAAIDEIIAHQDPNDYPNNKIGIYSPPTPPEPPTPLDHVIEMAKKGAIFYYEGEKITSDKAIELIKNNKNLNIDSRGRKGKNPQVRISKNPISIN